MAFWIPKASAQVCSAARTPAASVAQRGGPCKALDPSVSVPMAYVCLLLVVARRVARGERCTGGARWGVEL